MLCSVLALAQLQLSQSAPHPLQGSLDAAFVEAEAILEHHDSVLTREGTPFRLFEVHACGAARQYHALRASNRGYEAKSLLSEMEAWGMLEEGASRPSKDPELRPRPDLEYRFVPKLSSGAAGRYSPESESDPRCVILSTEQFERDFKPLELPVPYSPAQLEQSRSSAMAMTVLHELMHDFLGTPKGTGLKLAQRGEVDGLVLTNDSHSAEHFLIASNTVPMARAYVQILLREQVSNASAPLSPEDDGLLRARLHGLCSRALVHASPWRTDLGSVHAVEWREGVAGEIAFAWRRRIKQFDLPRCGEDHAELLDEAYSPNHGWGEETRWCGYSLPTLGRSILPYGPGGTGNTVVPPGIDQPRSEALVGSLEKPLEWVEIPGSDSMHPDSETYCGRPARPVTAGLSGK